MRATIRIVNLIILFLLLVGAGLTYWYAWRPLPEASGRAEMPVGSAAKITRDARGMPHIEAGSMEDALFLQGYTSAQDRLWQMDALRRVAAGELSEVIGAGGLESDVESRKMRMRRTAEEHAKGLKPEQRKWLAAYARGVNHFIETHRGRLPVEFTLLGYDPRPWTTADSILACLQMFRTLTVGWRDEILKQTLAQKGDRAKVEFLFPKRTGNEVQPGSNAWAISGKHTASGKPILANDTHLDWNFPGPWITVQLKTPEMNVEGFALPGVPGVVIGHNDRIAWGITNLQFDVQDLYAERIDLTSGRYVYQGKLEQARYERELIAVKDGKPVEVGVWITRHGPLFVKVGQVQLALRWTGSERGIFDFPILDVNRAKNWEEFRRALSGFPGPGSNFVYADVEGNIGYQAVGKLPVRKYAGDVPNDGSTGEHEWEGYIPFEELPSVYNPAAGYVITANQNPFPTGFGYGVGGNFASHYRSRQIEALLRSKEGWKPEEQLRIQTDVYSAFSKFLAEQAVAAYEARGRRNASLAPAVEALRGWDGQMRSGAAPLIVTLVFQQMRRAMVERASPGQGSLYETQMGPPVIEMLLRARPKEWFEDYDQLLLRCLVDGIEEGKKLQGTEIGKWDYGRYTAMTLAHPVMGRLPYVGRYFRIGPVAMAGASTTVKQTSKRLGPSMRFVADVGNWDGSLYSLTTGQSGHPLSKHFRDQWEWYIAGRAYPLEYGKTGAEGIVEIQPTKK